MGKSFANCKVICDYEGSLFTTHKCTCKKVFLYASYPQMFLIRGKERKIKAFASMRLELQDLRIFPWLLCVAAFWRSELSACARASGS